MIGSLQLSGLVGSVIVGTYMSRFDVKLLMICGVFVVGGSTVIFGAVGSIDNWESFFGLSIAMRLVMGF